MSTPQTYQAVETAGLVEAVRKLKQEGWRLVQISTTRLPEQVELTYSFDRQFELYNLRLLLPAPGARLPSISSVYWCAFIYENEIHDLFDVQVDGLAVDFHGNFYRTTVKHIFGEPPAVKAAPARKPAAAPKAVPPAHAETQPAAPTSTPAP